MSLPAEGLSGEKVILNEYRSKKILAQLGIPVIQESLVSDPRTAVRVANGIGFPVVLKVSGASLPHKTEVNGVALNLRSEAEVLNEGERLLAIPGCENLLVQKMAGGQRELVCGLTRDAHFGPCVMFGVGGVLTEALGDVVFRLAPLSSWDALEMIHEIKSQPVLGKFRGETAANIEALAGILVSLGLAGQQQSEILQIDINPLKILPNGNPVAVDALVVMVGKNTNLEK
jgi:succinyl-CoA synthetase beta subunit